MSLGFLTAVAASISANEVGIPKLRADAVFDNLLGLVYFAAGIVAVIIIIVAGLMYTLSNGDAQKVKTAKNVILYGLIGLVIVNAAFFIIGFIVERF